MNDDQYEDNGFRFFTGLLVSVCITASCAGLAAPLHYLY